MLTSAASILLILFLQAFFLLPIAHATTSPTVLLSEIQIEGAESGGKIIGDDEFIELYNPTGATLSLDGLKLCRKTSGASTTQLKSFSKNDAISAQGYFLFAHSAGRFGALTDAKSQSSPLAKNNSVALANDCASPTLIVDSLSWGSGKKFDEQTSVIDNPAAGRSLTRNLTSLAWSETILPSPTSSAGALPTSPGPPEATPEDSSLPPEPSPTTQAPNLSFVRLNEIFPDPSGRGDAGEFIELYNFGTEAADLGGWIIRDASKTGRYVLPAGTSLASGQYLAFTDQTFKFSLNNSDETVSLFDSSERLVNSVSYTKSQKDISLNYTASGWRAGLPTPGFANTLNTPPQTKEKVPKKGFRGMPVAFSAQGTDSDGDALKYVWDFGDGRKSYKPKTSHAYEKNGTYNVTLKTTDGKEDILETFTLKIVSYQYPKIRIVALMPNPPGNDADNEWLLIKNEGKKKVNLQGFSIATGGKKMTNHPIRGAIVIASKKERRLTSADALFTLPNKKGVVELRAPDGKVLQKITYTLAAGVPDGQVYRKEKSRPWQWQAPAIPRTQVSSEKTGNLFGGAVNTGVARNATPALPQGPASDPGVQTDPQSSVPDAPLQSNEVSNTQDRETARAFLALITTGTRITFSPEIARAVTAPPTQRVKPVPRSREHYAVSFAKESFSALNTVFNEAFNKAR